MEPCPLPKPPPPAAPHEVASKHSSRDPSPWVARFAGRIAPGGPVLDLACGKGRHSRYLCDLGHPVIAVDRDVSGLGGLAPRLVAIKTDLEDGSPLPFEGQSFAGIVVTNYLNRPLLARLPDFLTPGGVLIYETFSLDNLRYGRPSNPDFLLKPGELLRAVEGRLRVIAYEDLEVAEPWPAAIQRICAIRSH